MFTIPPYSSEILWMDQIIINNTGLRLHHRKQLKELRNLISAFNLTLLLWSCFTLGIRHVLWMNDKLKSHPLGPHRFSFSPSLTWVLHSECWGVWGLVWFPVLNFRSPVHSVIWVANGSFIVEYIYIRGGHSYTQGFFTLFSGMTSLRGQIQLTSCRKVFSHSIHFLFLMMPF